MSIKKSKKLKNICYDIRGPVLIEAQRMERAGEKIFKLHIGNTTPFGFMTDPSVLAIMATQLEQAEGYVESQGILIAREALAQEYNQNGFNVSADDIYIGNGVSELIVLTMQALLNDNDEILIPTPDYPLWTAAAHLACGKAVHYLCDEASGWQPDIEDIKKKITPKTKGIVIINPNNPTGAVYTKEVLEKIAELARAHNLIIFSDEIYDKIVYDDAKHTPIATLASQETLVVTFGGLSKVYRAPGFRVGWMILSGNKNDAEDYIKGLNILSNMRLCSNAIGQLAIIPALKDKSIIDLTSHKGRLLLQRNFIYEKINDIPGLSCTKPAGALYLFPKIDLKKYNITDDRTFIFDLLKKEKVLLVQGTGFNWHKPDHFRIVFLPEISDLNEAIMRITKFLEWYRQ